MRERLTYANVMATIAVFAALGGGAYAAATIGADDIKKNAVRAKHVKKNQIRAAHLRKGAVRAKHIGAATPGVALAGARVDSQGQVTSWFNRRGGKPTVELLAGSGRDVKFPGISAAATAIPTAMLLGGSTGEIYAGFANGKVRVRTSDSSGQDDPSGFALVLYKGKG
jgi:hypothetical protein